MSDPTTTPVPGAGKDAKAKQRAMPTRKEKQDISIMETNNSCITSKRSVEKIYHKDDHGFLRYFVKKFQRRSPLINRGYWLRMRAIDHVVRTFLKETAGKPRTVVNLGCGYDPLPFKFLSKHKDLCDLATFVDVDYRQLMQKKCETVRSTQELSSVINLDAGSTSSTETVLIDCPSYKAAACDLEDIKALQILLEDTLHLRGNPVLFLAEVSITYMDAIAAEKLIELTSTFDAARFAVLEQYLPDGEHHPFAVTMLAHFNKLNSPLKTAIRNPSAEDQKKRFAKGQWKDVDFRNLWSLWADDDFLPVAERRQLDEIEPFDEWEEFQLFCSHYFLLIARNTVSNDQSKSTTSKNLHTVNFHEKNQHGDVTRDSRLGEMIRPEYCLSPNEPRRFAGSLISSDSIWSTGGHGVQSRLNSVELLRSTGEPDLTYSPQRYAYPPLPTALMCHTLTQFGNDQALLVGGRTSPVSASAACYLKQGYSWTPTHALPFGLYRHSAVSVVKYALEGDCKRGVLVYGGKSSPTSINEGWLYWHQEQGWTDLEVFKSTEHYSGHIWETTSIPARFGATMVVVPHSSYGLFDHPPDDMLCSGFLTGGIGVDNTILDDFWAWSLHKDAQGKLFVRCSLKSIHTWGISKPSHFGRFGATMIYTGQNQNNVNCLLIGGVTNEGVLESREEVLSITLPKESGDLCDRDIAVVRERIIWPEGQRPLMVGCTVQAVDRYARQDYNETEWTNCKWVLAHGGAVCFSFGTYWNPGIWTVSTIPTTPWMVVKEATSILAPETQGPRHGSGASMGAPSALQSKSEGSSIGTKVNRTTVHTASDLDSIIEASKPVIITGMNLGSCTEKWTPEYLESKVGSDRSVVVHDATSKTMNFLAKDFKYTTLRFTDFLAKISAGAPMYLRAISSDTSTPTTLAADFPGLAPDFQHPQELHAITAAMHSSVLRISGPVAMWLHFDVMANIYCQIQGSKQLILFPPSDISHLDFPAGASSSRTSIFDDTGTAHYPANTHPIVCDVQPGDVLFIPPLWAHTAKPTTGTSVAVNVFFRSLDKGYAAGKDVYGNRDLQAYENGRRDVARVVKAFKGLPKEVERFYLERLAEELREAAGAL